MQITENRITLGELRKIFSDGKNGPKKRMEALDTETKLEAEIAQQIQDIIMQENPTEGQIKAILETAKTLLDREIVKINYGI